MMDDKCLLSFEDWKLTVTKSTSIEPLLNDLKAEAINVEELFHDLYGYCTREIKLPDLRDIYRDERDDINKLIKQVDNLRSEIGGLNEVVSSSDGIPTFREQLGTVLPTDGNILQALDLFKVRLEALRTCASEDLNKLRPHDDELLGIWRESIAVKVGKRKATEALRSLLHAGELALLPP